MSKLRTPEQVQLRKMIGGVVTEAFLAERRSLEMKLQSVVERAEKTADDIMELVLREYP